MLRGRVVVAAHRSDSNDCRTLRCARLSMVPRSSARSRANSLNIVRSLQGKALSRFRFQSPSTLAPASDAVSVTAHTQIKTRSYHVPYEPARRDADGEAEAQGHRPSPTLQPARYANAQRGRLLAHAAHITKHSRSRQHSPSPLIAHRHNDGRTHVASQVLQTQAKDSRAPLSTSAASPDATSPSPRDLVARDEEDRMLALQGSAQQVGKGVERLLLLPIIGHRVDGARPRAIPEGVLIGLL